MKKWLGMMVLGIAMMSWQAPAHAFQLQDFMSVKTSNPIEIWKKMRPQDFVGAPTIWEIIV
jgi:hypothetical protein